MNRDGRRRFAAAAAAIATYAACAPTTPAPEAAAPWHDQPLNNHANTHDTADSYRIDTPRPPQARASRGTARTTTTTPRVVEGTGPRGCTLDDIKRMESGGRYDAVSASGRYRGAYQFDAGTWRSVGGTGDPAAASPAEQDARAAELMRRRGTQPWSVCR